MVVPRVGDRLRFARVLDNARYLHRGLHDLPDVVQSPDQAQPADIEGLLAQRQPLAADVLVGVRETLRQLRMESGSLGDFIDRAGSITSVTELKELVASDETSPRSRQPGAPVEVR